MVVFEVRVSLAGAEPAVWRRVRMPGGLQLGMVHLVLQMAMGWTNSHQHEFAGADRKRYGSAEGHDLLPGVLNERHCRLSSLISEPGDGCLYRYDFGDDWMHEVVLEAVLEMDKPDEPLWCLDGQGACPPENCGGVAGYLELLEHFRESDSVEHVEAVEQLGKDFDPNAFDCGEFNEMIRAKDSMNDAMISSEDMVKAFEMLMELQVFLESDAVSDRAMSVLMLDGFFAALAIYPVPILLKQWLPFVWDRSGSGQQPVFATEKQKDTVIGQIHLLMNSINIRLTGANGMYEPPFVSLEPESAADRMQAAMEWASGFIRGAMIDKNVWERTLGDEEGNDLLLPFSVMSGIIDEETGIDPARMVEIRTLLIDDLGECVLDMRDFWRPWKSASMAVNSRGSKGNAHSRVGRNDPCPCGSGKKFKQCCGKQRRGEQ